MVGLRSAEETAYRVAARSLADLAKDIAGLGKVVLLHGESDLASADLPSCCRTASADHLGKEVVA
jgi:hypothetical protein